MERAISTINYLPSNKEGIKKYTDKAISEILEGYEDPIKIAIQLKAMETIIDIIRSDEKVKKLIRNELEKYGNVTTNENAKIELAETGVKYDYSGCNLEEWKTLDNQIKLLASKKKGIEDYLKSLKEQTINETTGELINPPVKTSQSSFKITLK